MNEVSAFLHDMLPRQISAERAIHDGDVGPRLALWTRTDPVTSYEFELVAAGASGDLAYTVGLEHTSATVEGAPRTYTLRVTHVYRREDGAWRIVHRHGDAPPVASGLAFARTSTVSESRRASDGRQD
jgi:ketosteroid isomerase-like protein